MTDDDLGDGMLLDEGQDRLDGALTGREGFEGHGNRANASRKPDANRADIDPEEGHAQEPTFARTASFAAASAAGMPSGFAPPP